MFLCQLSSTTRIIAIDVAQTNNAPADSALPSTLSSQHWVRVGVSRLVNALVSLQVGFNAEGDHTTAPLIPDPTIADTCSGHTLNCPKECVDIVRVGHHAPRRSYYTAQGPELGVNWQHLL